MATTKFYLDIRAVGSEKPAPLKLAINRKGETALIHLNVSLLPSQWDKTLGKVYNHPNKLFLNTYITKRKIDIDTIILKLLETGEINKMRANEIKKHIVSEISSDTDNKDNEKLFAYRFRKFAESKKESTQKIYFHTFGRIKEFTDNIEKLTFDSITKDWLNEFESFLSKTSPSKNARNIHLRNIRAVFNDAIDDEITEFYPFRKFKIRPVATVKRSLTAEQLHTLFNANVEEHAEKYLDTFKLIFYLIGINIIDLCHLSKIINGRIEYYRSKTNRLYSINVEPEAMEIIEKYRGEKLLLNILDRYKNHKDYAKRLNENLQRIGETKIGKQGKKTFKPIFPEITTYWARHTWATLAAELDIPKETIAAALGHGGNTVTDIYIDFDRKKVDEANRKVIDYVNSFNITQ